jgi:protein-tyrosine phosphatase
VLVHCKEGVSRSATVALAFLMQKRRLTVKDALRQVHDRRDICPNDGFLQKLCDLNDQLVESGHFKNE